MHTIGQHMSLSIPMVIVDYSQHSQTNQLGGANIDMLIIWIILNPML
jgi:hypothetical protein